MSNDQLSISDKLKQWRAENASAPKAPSANSNRNIVGPKATLPSAPLYRSIRNRDSLPAASSHAARTIEGKSS
jgi:hypothetical protein